MWSIRPWRGHSAPWNATFMRNCLKTYPYVRAWWLWKLNDNFGRNLDVRNFKFSRIFLRIFWLYISLMLASTGVFKLSLIQRNLLNRIRRKSSYKIVLHPVLTLYKWTSASPGLFSHHLTLFCVSWINQQLERPFSSENFSERREKIEKTTEARSMSIPLEAETIALKAYQKPSKVQLSQTRHRVKIVEEFNIVPGKSLLQVLIPQNLP